MIRDGALHMTAYFRSHNAYTHGLADLYYMRRAQIDMVDAIKAKAIKPEIQECGVGSMTLFFNRAFAPHTIRVPKRKKTPSRRVFPHSQQQRFLKHLKSR